MADISEKILNLMETQNISYGELSKTTGIPKSALHRYTHGQAGKMKLPRLEAIAAALHVDPAYLIGWEEQEVGKQYELLMDLFGKISPEAQSLVIAQLQGIAQSQQDPGDH